MFANTDAFYIAGLFTNVGSGPTAANRAARYSISAGTWTALGSGFNNEVYDILLAPNGILYATGVFSTADGATVQGVAQWNGTAWAGMGSGMAGTMGTAAGNSNGRRLFRDINGTVIVGGTFASTTIGGIVMPDNVARWTGTAWVPLTIDLPGTATVYGIGGTADGVFYLGFSTTGSATAAAVSTATNAGAQITYPRVTITGPASGTSRIYSLINTTTGGAVYLDYTIASGETAILIFDPANPSYTSDSQGNIANRILPGSTPGQLYLTPGANSISVFAASSTVTVTFDWQLRYGGIDDLVN